MSTKGKTAKPKAPVLDSSESEDSAPAKAKPMKKPVKEEPKKGSSKTASKPKPDDSNDSSEGELPTKPSKKPDPPKEASKPSNKKAPEKASEKAPENSTDNARSGNFRYNQIDMKNIQVDLKSEKGQDPMAFLNYNDSTTKQKRQIRVQTGWMTNKAGIPELDAEYKKRTGMERKKQYYPDNTKREFIKVALDPEQTSCQELKEFFDRADEHFGSRETRVEIFGDKKADNYIYSPLVRPPFTGEEDDNEDDSKKGKESKKKGEEEKPRYETCKMKFNVDRESHAIKTKFVKIDRKEKTTMNFVDITAITKEIKFRSEVKMVFVFSRMWTMKNTNPKIKDIEYGISLKVIAIQYKPNEGSAGNTNVSFDSDSEEEEENTKKQTSKTPAKVADKPAGKVVAKPTKGPAKSESSEESEDKPPAKGKPVAKPTKKAQTKSESDSEAEEKKPAKGKKAQAKSESASDSESDSDSDNIPVKKNVATKTQKKTAKSSK
jgi:hypothetical protein